MSDKPPHISVIIPFYSGEEILEKCITSLLNQTVSKTSYEIIVVENREKTHIRKRQTGVKYLLEPRRGSYAARNRGVKAAQGDILAFTDADCIPNRDWLKKGVEKIYEGADVVGGKIAPLEDEVRKLNTYELYDMLFSYDQTSFYEKKFFATANMFIKRKKLEEAGYFDETLYSGGDRLLGNRLNSANAKSVYFPNALVYHPLMDKYHKLADKVKRKAAGSANIWNSNRRIKSQGPENAVKFFVKDQSRIATAKDIRVWKKIKLSALHMWLFLVWHVEMAAVLAGKKPKRM